MNTQFDPRRIEAPTVKSLLVRLTPEFHKQIKDEAAKRGVTVQDFSVQALEYALANLGEKS